jgi:hypothetical protein
VMGDREVHLEPISKGTQEAFGLPERKVEHHAEGQRSLIAMFA